MVNVVLNKTISCGGACVTFTAFAAATVPDLAGFSIDFLFLDEEYCERAG